MKKLSWAVLVVFAFGLRAADAPRRDSGRDKTNEPPSAAKAEGKKDEAKPTAATIPDATHKPVLTTNTVTIAGQRVTYVAEAGMLPLLKPDGGVRASVFYTAYSRQVDTNEPPRPVTFCFNGGPGSSSVWLHLGALGPRRVKMNDDGTLPKQPFGLVDNDYSILNVTDLVFIDPVATGFSRAAKDEKPEEFFGQSADVESVGEFIRLWTSRHERWLAPKFLCGESYGVFRAAGLAEHLQSRYGMYLSGLILVSGVLDFAALGEGPGNDLGYLIYLPAYTSIAHFHKRLPPDLQADLPKARAEAREFARAEYPAALLQGAALPPAQRSNIVAKLARLTGLPPSVVEENDLRVDSSIFRKMLLHDRGLILGRYDARITGRDANPAARGPRFDPSYSAAYGPFSAAMNSYLRQELKFEDDLPYELLAGVGPWNYDARNSYPSVAGRLASVMSQNTYLRVLVLGGLCDLACPIDNLHYSVEHMQLDPAYRSNFTYTEYQSGHMMYLNLPDLQKMQRDVEGFIRQ